MIVSVILAHPYEQSFNAAIAQSVCAQLRKGGHHVNFHDLQSEGFDPVMPKEELAEDRSTDELVQLHQKEIQAADGIVIIHPNWWGQPPAILKGWVDRVLRENIAYRFPEGDTGGGLPIGMLKAKIGIVFNTSNTPADRENEIFGDPLERVWKDCIFAFCGINAYDRRMFRVIADSSSSERQQWLQEVEAVIERHFSVPT